MIASTHSPVRAEAPAAKTRTRRSGLRSWLSSTRDAGELRVFAELVGTVRPETIDGVGR